MVVVEGYEYQLKEAKRMIESRYDPSRNPIDGKPMNYSPAVRKAELWDITFPDVIEKQVLRDLGHYKKDKIYRIRPIEWILKIFKPFLNGWYRPTQDEKAEPKVKIPAHKIVLAKKKDKKMVSGYECV